MKIQTSCNIIFIAVLVLLLNGPATASVGATLSVVPNAVAPAGQGQAPPLPVAPQPATALQAGMAEALQFSPVMFIENVGQFAKGARFQVRGDDRTIWLAEDGIWVTVMEEPYSPPGPSDHHLPSLQQRGEMARGWGEIRGVHIKLSFPGSNPHPHLEPFHRLDTVVSYFIGNDPAKWRANVPIWGGVRYKDLYPGIDLEIIGENGRLVQRLVARPGADLSTVRLRVEGADTVALLPSPAGGRGARDKGLLMRTVLGDFTLPLLTVEGATPDSQPATLNPIPGTFEIASPFSSAPPLSPSSAPPLLIPSAQTDLLYATFLGGSDWESGDGIAVDASGAAYVTGYTQSPDFPTTPGAYDTTRNGPDAFVVKLNPSGGGLAYATFLGGSGWDAGNSIAVDSSGGAYVTGVTPSSDFPATLGAYDTTFNGGDDAFVVKLHPSGDRLAYATFLGGDDDDGGYGITVDASGVAYVTGWTYSSNFPTTPGAYDTTYGGWDDGFVVKLNPSGSALAYATFLGGSGFDVGHSIAVDSSGAAYVTGETGSLDFPTTSGAYDTACNYGNAFMVRLNPSGGGMPYDVFVVKLNSSGGSLAYATLLGGSSDDKGNGIAVDASGAAYVTGETCSLDFPTTLGAFDTTLNGGWDAFLVKLNPSGSNLAYATLLGGSSDDKGSGIAVDASDAAYITGQTGSSDFPTTLGAYDTAYNGGDYDAFVVKFNLSGGELAYATFLGGGDRDQGYGIAVDANGVAYVMGGTSSYDFPTTLGTYDPTYNGGYKDAFVAKLAVGGPQIVVIRTGEYGLTEINRYLCPGPILLPILAAVGDPTGLDWFRLYYRLNANPENYVEMLLSPTETSASFEYQLGPFGQSGTVSYYFRARNAAGRETREPATGYFTLTIKDCPTCTSWTTDFWPPDDGLKFANFGGNCAGMSATSLDYFDSNLPIPTAYNHWVEPPGSDPENPLSCYIQRRSLATNDHTLPYLLMRLQQSPSHVVRNAEEYQKIRNRIVNAGMPALIGLGPLKGHSIVVYALTECTDGQVVLYAYDSNKVLELTGAYPSLVEGHYISGNQGLQIDYTSTVGPFGTYPAIFADFTVTSSQYPDLSSGCETDDIDLAYAEVAETNYSVDPTTVVQSHLDQDGEPVTYQFLHAKGISSAVFVSWSGSTLRLRVYRPDGSLFAQRESSRSPLFIEIPETETDGIWSYEIIAVSVPQDDYPCISLVSYKWHSCYLPLVMRGR